MWYVVPNIAFSFQLFPSFAFFSLDTALWLRWDISVSARSPESLCLTMACTQLTSLGKLLLHWNHYH